MTILTADLLASFDASVDRRRHRADDAARRSTPRRSSSPSSAAPCSPTSGCASAWRAASPNVGDYFTTTVNGEPIIVARAKDGAVRAFSSICQHRGMQVADDAGNCTKFTCPYHLWSYDLTGRLLGAPAMERTRGLRQEGLPAAGRCKVELWQGFVFVHFDPDAAPLGADARRLRALRRALRPRARRLPGHVHAPRPAVELEGDVRELQRRLPRQQAPPHDPGLLPERAGRLPGGVDRDVERHLPHQRLHPHRRRLQRHDEGAAADLPRPHRGGALALDVRADAADAVLRHRTGPGVLLHRAAEDGRHDRPRDRLPVPPERARSTRCSTT